MKRLRIALIALALTGTANAQNVHQQLLNSVEIFLGSQEISRADFSARYRSSIFDNIDGTWVSVLDFPLDMQPQLCESQPQTIQQSGAFSFEIKVGGHGVFRIEKYIHQSGARFMKVTDPANDPSFGDLDPNSQMDQGILENMLRVSNRPVNIFRASPDVLVIQADGFFPEIYARCDTALGE